MKSTLCVLLLVVCSVGLADEKNEIVKGNVKMTVVNSGYMGDKIGIAIASGTYIISWLRIEYSGKKPLRLKSSDVCFEATNGAIYDVDLKAVSEHLRFNVKDGVPPNINLQPGKIVDVVVVFDVAQSGMSLVGGWLVYDGVKSTSKLKLY